jgi:hypothetical protein
MESVSFQLTDPQEKLIKKMLQQTPKQLVLLLPKRALEVFFLDGKNKPFFYSNLLM